MTAKKNKQTKTNTRKEPFRDPQFTAFVPSLHAQSQSGNSLTVISSQIPAAVKR